MNKFITAIKEYPFKDNNIGARNRLIIKTILYTGIRVGEAITINKKDFIKDGDAYMIQVRGKGNKPRVVMIKEKIIKNDLALWLDFRNCEENLLFCNQKTKTLCPRLKHQLKERLILLLLQCKCCL